MKIKKSLIGLFILNYIGIISLIILSILIFILSFLIQISVDRGFMQSANAGVFQFSDKYIELNKADILKRGGWIEKLKGSEIVSVEGNKADSFSDYSINNIINNKDLDSDLYVKAYVINEGSENFTYIVKVPRNSNLSVDTFSKLGRYAIISLIIAFAFIITVLCIMTYASIRMVKKPFRDIQKAVEDINSGNYKQRLTFKGYKEIDYLKDSFNYMLDTLQHSEERRLKSEEGKRQIIRDLSHDIKTPVTSILGYSEILMKNKEENEGNKIKYAKYIYEKTCRLNYLVENLFNYVKLDSLNYSLDLKQADLCEILRNTVASYYLDIEAKNFNLQLDIPEKPILYKADEKELQRAIGNIISNSIKYNKENTKLKISLKEDEEAKFIIIEDNGIGISANKINYIFNEFVRGDEARSGTEGSGLGLSISKKIVNLHGGSIKLISNENEFCIFIIKLPNI